MHLIAYKSLITLSTCWNFFPTLNISATWMLSAWPKIPFSISGIILAVKGEIFPNWFFLQWTSENFSRKHQFHTWVLLELMPSGKSRESLSRAVLGDCEKKFWTIWFRSEWETPIASCQGLEQTPERCDSRGDKGDLKTQWFNRGSRAWWTWHITRKRRN